MTRSPLADGLGPKQRAALEAISPGSMTVAEVSAAAGCSHSTLRSLEARGLVEIEEREQRRRPGIRRGGRADARRGRA